MRTTIDFPDSLFYRAKLTASPRQPTLKAFLTEVLESALGGETPRQMITVADIDILLPFLIADHALTL